MDESVNSRGRCGWGNFIPGKALVKILAGYFDPIQVTLATRINITGYDRDPVGLGQRFGQVADAVGDNFNGCYS
jgi:hypothetical protein